MVCYSNSRRLRRLSLRRLVTILSLLRIIGSLSLVPTAPIVRHAHSLSFHHDAIGIQSPAIEIVVITKTRVTVTNIATAEVRSKTTRGCSSLIHTPIGIVGATVSFPGVIVACDPFFRHCFLGVIGLIKSLGQRPTTADGRHTPWYNIIMVNVVLLWQERTQNAYYFIARHFSISTSAVCTAR